MTRFFALKRGSLISLALAALLALAPAIAEARMGGGGSFGSRGSRSWSAPPSTRTAPGMASPFERSITPRPGPGMSQPGYNPAFGGSSFGRGLLGGLAGGLLGAGLFGLLTGNGFFGGIGGFMSIIGFLMQIALVVFLARMAFMWWANRNAPAGAGSRPGAPFGSMFTGGAPFGAKGPGAGGFRAAGFGSGAAPQGARATPLKVQAEDFNAFERLLGETQAAYSREDLGALRMMSTPEMASYFDDELDENRRKGVVNRVSDVKLLQGDLSEAWREGSDEYATVAMRFSLNDVMEDRATGKPTPGSPGKSEAVEVWTFRRPAGAGPQEWKLSAIQQAA
ncbi:TIM44-like domain-containing protein [Methylocystis sp. ATCC 49242]|uniref:TIM44-like domain-containing protein n=1 Tax=Methylocystis sp. ATCC 49242 TaxID=622637 RepID=UPI0001F8681A|nr:TIM44-like domain-containing protein [Methylocystis sp. ATCC 49242]